MLRDRTGNRVFRRVELKIFFPPDVLPVKKLTYHPKEAHQAYGPEGIDAILMHTADQLDQLYPFWEFKMNALKPQGRVARYNFNFIGYRVSPDVIKSLNVPDPNVILAPSNSESEQKSEERAVLLDQQRPKHPPRMRIRNQNS